MKFGVVLPGGAAPVQLEHARLAERSGWDGVFVWEGPYGVDAWSLLSAMAVATERVRLGTMLTPLPWRRPWKVASQAATLDQLSGGRAILAVGLGATGLGDVGDPGELRERADLLDDGLDVIDALWRQRPRVAGKRLQVDFGERPDLLRMAAPVQTPRIPIWVVGVWPRPKSMRRVLRCDGLLPNYKDRDGTARPITPDDVREMVRWIDEHGGRREAFDVVVEGETPADRARGAEIVAPWAAAGATWWLETRWELPHDSPERLRDVDQRLAAGPPG